MDKHPQSKQRGITLDLGFSSFQTAAPDPLKLLGHDRVQYTLVDCPGHASLIRTVIGGASIINSLLLVIDVTKGIQSQTAECIVIAEVCVQGPMVVVLNKVDLLPPEKKDRYIRKAEKRVTEALSITKFSGCPVVAVSSKTSEGLDILVQTLNSHCSCQKHDDSLPFLCVIDHCFAVKGQGTVLTGTVAQGSAKVGDAIELPELGQTRKIKSMQAFKRAVTSCSQGDRVGLCVPQFDAQLMERGLAAAPNTIPTFTAGVARIEKIRFYGGEVHSKSRMHIILGHTTVMAELTFLLQEKNSSTEYEYLDVLQNYCEVYLMFASPVTAPPQALLLAAKLDADMAATSACRLAFHGRLTQTFGSFEEGLETMKIFKIKKKEGFIERVEGGGRTAICRGMFSKNSDISPFIGMRISVERTHVKGTILSAFGKSGKFRVEFEHNVEAGNIIYLHFKRYTSEKHHISQ